MSVLRTLLSVFRALKVRANIITGRTATLCVTGACSKACTIKWFRSTILQPNKQTKHVPIVLCTKACNFLYAEGSRLCIPSVTDRNYCLMFPLYGSLGRGWSGCWYYSADSLGFHCGTEPHENVTALYLLYNLYLLHYEDPYLTSNGSPSSAVLFLRV